MMSFDIGDKVIDAREVSGLDSLPGEIVRISREINYPGYGIARKIWWVPLGKSPEIWNDNWSWDFELEAW
jgi:hypothetical protein